MPPNSPERGQGNVTHFRDMMRLRWCVPAMTCGLASFMPVLAGSSPSAAPTAGVSQPVSADLPAERTPRWPPSCASDKPQSTLRLGFLGDFYIGTRARKRLAADSESRLRATLKTLRQSVDALVANLEGVLTERTTRAFPDQRFAHRMAPQLAAELKSWGLSGLTLANNHAMDYGIEGLNDTRTALTAAGLHFAGAGRNADDAEIPMVFHHQGLTGHVLSFNATFPMAAWAGPQNPGVAYPYPERLRERVARSAREADLVIVSFHWGEEGAQALRDYQPVLARAAIAAGADFVYGHHSHSAQPIHREGAATIAYGLGNFSFDSYSRRAGFGLAALVQLCATGPRSQPKTAQPHPERTVSVAFVPLNTNNYETHFGTVPMDAAALDRAAKPLLDQGDIHPEVAFWIPAEDRFVYLRPPAAPPANTRAP